VRTVAGLFAAANQAGKLAAWFAGDPNLTEEQRRVVETEEAWTLGVMAPRPSATAPRPPSVPSRAPSARRRGEGLKAAALQSSPSPCVRGEGRGEGQNSLRYNYLREPDAIYRASFAAIRAEADLARFPAALRPLALRLAHAAGDVAILDDLVWSRGAVRAGMRVVAAGMPVLVDAEMVAAGIIRDRLAAQNRIICTLRDRKVAGIAAAQRTTRSAAAVELWRPYLNGAVVAIGNAPTALFRLLEVLAEGADRPALVLGFPVGFVGAAEAKEALIGFGNGLAYVALGGRRGGSALAAAAVNALAAGTRA
jgi:precorrin-8X/cobalt-precorrin-8 methylmutase